MTSDYLKQSRSLDEIYALIDKNRVEAARAAQAKFHNDMEAAIATIAGISTIACARVQADSRVASAKVMINAELVATRLLAEAEAEASKCAEQMLIKSSEAVEAALREIGRHTSLRLAEAAKLSVQQIQQDAEAAIKLLRETGAIAIREVQTLASSVAEQTRRDAELAAEKLHEYRRQAHTPKDAISEGEDLAEILVNAAQEASDRLRQALNATLANINTITDEACRAVHEASLAAEKNISDSRDKALTRLKETLQAYR